MSLRFPGNFFLMAAFLAAAIPLLSCSARVHPSVNTTIKAVAFPGKINDDILDYVNQYRQSKGLAPLEMNAVISAAAEQHSSNMANRKTAFGHDGFEQRIKSISEKLGILHKSAENVAYGHLNAKQVVDVWLKSPGHRRNLEGKYTLTGIGVARTDDGTIFFTQIFAAK